MFKLIYTLGFSCGHVASIKANLIFILVASTYPSNLWDPLHFNVVWHGCVESRQLRDVDRSARPLHLHAGFILRKTWLLKKRTKEDTQNINIVQQERKP